MEEGRAGRERGGRREGGRKGGEREEKDNGQIRTNILTEALLT